MSAEWYDTDGGIVPRAWSGERRAGAARLGRLTPVLLWLAIALIVLVRAACFLTERASGPAGAVGAFSSEAASDSRIENVSNQESGALLRFHLNGTAASARQVDIR